MRYGIRTGGLKFSAGVGALLICAGMASAQFASSSLKSSSRAVPDERDASSTPDRMGAPGLKICNATLLPPADTDGPWQFTYCSRHGAPVIECDISAKAYVADALSASALRARVISAAMGVSAGALQGNSDFSIQCHAAHGLNVNRP